jgi:hypothetical protein
MPDRVVERMQPRRDRHKKHEDSQKTTDGRLQLRHTNTPGSLASFSWLFAFFVAIEICLHIAELDSWNARVFAAA